MTYMWRHQSINTDQQAHYSHLLQDDTCCLIDGSSYSPVPTGVADEGPRQYGHHDHTQSAVTHQGKGRQADEKQHTWNHVEEAHQDKQHCRCPESAEEIFWLLPKKEKNRRLRTISSLIVAQNSHQCKKNKFISESKWVGKHFSFCMKIIKDKILCMWKLFYCNSSIKVAYV